MIKLLDQMWDLLDDVLPIVCTVGFVYIMGHFAWYLITH